MTDSNAGLAEPTKRKRGRPPGSTTEKRRKLLPKREESDSDQQAFETGPVHHGHNSQTTQKLLQKYQDALKAYEKTVFNTHTHHVLRRIAADATIQSKSQQEPVLQQLMDVAKKLLLSEVEMVIWALHLGQSKIADIDMSLHSALLVSAYYVKVTLGTDVSHIQAFLDKQNSAFQKNLETWEQTHPKETLSFSFQDVNAKWKLLRRAISEEDVPVINYNYYVDDILQAGVTPVDQFTSVDCKPLWHQSTPALMDVPEVQQLRPIKPVPTSMSAFDSVFAKECEDFSYAPIPWFEQVPVSPGLLFYNFPSPPASALLQPLDESFDAQGHFRT